MLREFVRLLRVRCSPAARRLGLAREHAAIAARHARVRETWTPHLTASREAILAGAARCTQTQRALVIGAGDCLDVPVEELAERFESVVLADVVVSPVARAFERRLRGRVGCVRWDATGALETLASGQRSLKSADARRILADADPGPPPGGEPDLAVSANCLSQLGLVPGHALDAAGDDEALPERCATVAARRHLDWLAQRVGVRVVVADIARLDIAPDGRLLHRENLLERFRLRRPDRQWRWDLALIPEWDPEYHRVHEVGAWIDGPRGATG